jgi:hypothetical protein
MTKSQKKALRFAYRLMCGDYTGQFLIYTAGYWIEPDHDPTRPYLDENVFMELVMRGYMECQTFERDRTVYLYRITPEGCAAMGWTYPFHKNLRRHNGFHPYFDGHRRGRHVPFPPHRHPPVFGGRSIRVIRRLNYASQKMA